jgi:hypothetical protein
MGLLQEEINFNQEHAKKRIVIEHTISVDWKNIG